MVACLNISGSGNTSSTVPNRYGYKQDFHIIREHILLDLMRPWNDFKLNSLLYWTLASQYKIVLPFSLYNLSTSPTLINSTILGGCGSDSTPLFLSESQQRHRLRFPTVLYTSVSSKQRRVWRAYDDKTIFPAGMLRGWAGSELIKHCIRSWWFTYIKAKSLTESGSSPNLWI